MTAMIEVSVDTLSGAALAYAVAVSEGLIGELVWFFEDDGTFGNIWTDDHGCYRPDEWWDIGGPLIDKHAIGFVGHDADTWLAFASPADQAHQGFGPTHLIAACRMIITAELGDTVTVPAELVQAVQP